MALTKAEMKQGRSTCFGRRRTLPHSVGSGHVHERLELVVQLALSPVATDQPMHHGHEATPDCHPPSNGPGAPLGHLNESDHGTAHLGCQEE